MRIGVKSSGTLRDKAGRQWLKFTNARHRYGAIVADAQLLGMPEAAQRFFQKHEEFVSKQAFSLTDEIEKQISEFDLAVVWDEDEHSIPIFDVQLMGNSISFKTSNE